MYTVEQKRDFQDLLKDQRRSRGWTQTDAGEESGLGQRVVSELERGPAPGAPFLTIAKLAYTYGLSLDYIAKILGIAPESVEVAEEEKHQMRGLSTDYFLLPKEEQARVVRILNYVIYDMLNISGDGIKRIAPEKFESVVATAASAEE